MDLFSSLERDFKELHCFSLLEMVETCAGEKGLAYFTLQSCKSSSPWSFSFRLQFRLRVSPACRRTAIMARRTGEKPLLLTPSRRPAFRDKHTRFHLGLLAFSWSFVFLCSALSCGYCGAESEFSILEEAQVLADQMKKLSSQELGVFTMQVSVG